MPESKREKLVFTKHDLDYHNLSAYETDEQKQEKFADINGKIPNAGSYWTVQPHPNRNQSMK